MKKTLKQLIVSMLSVSLIITQTPVAILAQTESESEATSETTEEVTDEAELTHPFDELIANGNLMDDILIEVYDDFKYAIDRVQIHDVALWTGEGTTIEELEGLLEIDQSVFREALGEDEEYISYRYYKEGMEDQVEGLTAELMFYFVEGNLIYVGVIPISHVVEPEQLLPEADIEAMYNQTTTLDDFIALNPIVSSFAQSYYEGQPMYLINTASGEFMDEIQAEMFIFRDDVFEMSYYLPYVRAIEYLNQSMLQVFIQHFNSLGLAFGVPVTSEEVVEPAAEEEAVVEEEEVPSEESVEETETPEESEEESEEPTPEEETETTESE
ncbi:hypothetical protein [Fundicoccus culcitae]|uniref:Uncharacterized protein n=1 Tax=Fundicoccus culcitae TaxID=2969821 RepID=A0ABY5P5K3_9LACT|nr:hypothetical protein [Fundicoccus culcitae]UUX33708.1 hypothetical protein NRE15_12495 [Fundicoccus culcitae]